MSVPGPSPVPRTQWSSPVTTDLRSWQAVRKSLRTPLQNPHTPSWAYSMFPRPPARSWLTRLAGELPVTQTRRGGAWL